MKVGYVTTFTISGYIVQDEVITQLKEINPASLAEIEALAKQNIALRKPAI